MTDTLLKIGELAERTGISVRALHHYEEIGLLAPSARSGANYRLYGPEEIDRLQQILSLRSLGLSLDEIKEALGRPDYSPLATIERQLGAARKQLADQEHLLERLDGIARFARTQKVASTEDLLEVIAAMSRVESSFTEEEREEIRERAKTVGRERIVQAEQEWPALIAAVKTEMEKGTDPSDPRVKTLAARWKALVEEFTGGNPAIAAKLKKMYEENQPLARQWNGPDPAMMEYVRKAIST